MRNLKLLLIILVIFVVLNSVSAVTVNCGKPYTADGFFRGDYIFTNNDSYRVKVFIDNRFSLINIYPNNTFYLEPGESKILSFRAYTDVYDSLPVTYSDVHSGISSSLVCRFYATQEGNSIPVLTTTPTTTTVVDYNSNCSNKAFYNCIILPGCKWVGGLFSGYCKSIYDGQNNEVSTTTTTSTTTITTMMQTTTTLINSCNPLNFWQCQGNSNCKWLGDFRLGRCVVAYSSTTTTTTTTTTSTTTTIHTTTSICSTLCTRWLRLTCLEWKTVCTL